jgi:arabinose-5-phosphate isomerase
MSAAERLPIARLDVIRYAAGVIRAEADALQQLAARMPVEIDQAVEMVVACRGSIIVTGVGKAGWIGQKISATFASTGARSHFLHPSEAMHGDLGRIGDDDLVVALSNSGETDELLQILPAIRRRKIPLIAISGDENSSLSRQATLTLCYGRFPEACHLGLAPSTTTTAMLALGDALALAVCRERNFQAVDFARYHPGGSLGRSLSKVEEIMRPLERCRIANQSETVRSVYVRLRNPDRRSGAILLVDDAGALTGMFTDSDLARLLERQQDAMLDGPMSHVMTRNPISVPRDQRTLLAVETMACHNISELPVIDSRRQPIGLIDITDVVGLLPRSGT